jgi:hypothetical protein
VEPEPKILFKGNEKYWEGLSGEGEWDTGSGWGRSQVCGLRRSPVLPDPQHRLPSGLAPDPDTVTAGSVFTRSGGDGLGAAPRLSSCKP